MGSVEPMTVWATEAAVALRVAAGSVSAGDRLRLAGTLVALATAKRGSAVGSAV